MNLLKVTFIGSLLLGSAAYAESYTSSLLVGKNDGIIEMEISAVDRDGFSLAEQIYKSMPVEEVQSTPILLTKTTKSMFCNHWLPYKSEKEEYRCFTYIVNGEFLPKRE